MKPSKRNIRNDIIKKEKLSSGKPKISKYAQKMGIEQDVHTNPNLSKT